MEINGRSFSRAFANVTNSWNWRKLNIYRIYPVEFEMWPALCKFPILFSAVKCNCQFIYRFKIGTFQSWFYAVLSVFCQFAKRLKIRILKCCSGWTSQFFGIYIYIYIYTAIFTSLSFSIRTLGSCRNGVLNIMAKTMRGFFILAKLQARKF